MKVVLSIPALTHNQFFAHFAPLIQSPRVSHVYVVCDRKGPALPKVCYYQTPWMLKYLFSKHIAKFFILLWVALTRSPDFYLGLVPLPHAFNIFLVGKILFRKPCAIWIIIDSFMRPFQPKICFQGSGVRGQKVENRGQGIGNRVPVCKKDKTGCIQETKGGRFGKDMIAGLVHHFDLILSVGKNNLAELKKKRMGHRQLVEMNGAIDPNRFFPAGGAGLSKDYDIITVSALEPRKNLTFLIEVVARLRREGKNCLTLILGEGKERQKLIQYAQNLGIQDWIHFGGFVPTVEDYLNRSKIFVLPSLWEGISVAAEEAMASGLPVVCFDVASMKELVQDRVNGFLVPAFDQNLFYRRVELLLGDTPLRKKMGLHARQTIIDRFSYEMAYRQWEQIFQGHTQKPWVFGGLPPPLGGRVGVRGFPGWKTHFRSVYRWGGYKNSLKGSLSSCRRGEGVRKSLSPSPLTPLPSHPSGSPTREKRAGLRRSRRKRILIAVQDMSVPNEGRIWFQARALREEGYAITVICPFHLGSGRFYEKQREISIWRFPKPEGRSVLGYVGEYAVSSVMITLYSLILFSTDCRFEILHYSTPPDIYYPLSFLFKILGVCLVNDVHDLSLEFYEARFSKRDTLYGILRLLEWGGIQSSDMVLAPNEAYLNRLRGRTPLHRKETFAFATSLEPDLIQKVKELRSREVERSRGQGIYRSYPPLDSYDPMLPIYSLMREGRKMVLHRSMLEEKEGVWYFFEAARHIIQVLKRQDIVFVQTGLGSLREALQNRVAGEKIGSFFSLMGFIEDKIDLYGWIQRADLCVGCDVKNDFNEYLTSLKHLEYLAFGKPILVFDLEQSRKTLKDAARFISQDSILLAQEICSMMDYLEVRQVLSEKAQQVYNQYYSWDVQKQNVLRAYSSLTS